MITNTDACVGCGLCAFTVPEVFDQEQEHGTVVLLDPEPPHELHQDVWEAARSCPGEAISVKDF
ncbi:ferredoxin [Streptomyces iconiensis]|uniref:Ferredoxin n=1 Tax=Streptomyces iconiensis TaxID=1384038 RepID=A0ABT7A0E0_9ACTN|nr:ferredoxin [Streptomyces iconiensis]MDJ1134789.1 ferredoxin [Streptomyces iconiensis]